MPLDTTTPLVRGDLLAATNEPLRAYFDRQGHRPSAAHWAALNDIADTLTAMANGTSDPMIYLSACDCGVGKSQTLVHFLKALAADAAYRDVGVIVCVGRFDEAKALTDDLDRLGVPKTAVEVLTSDPSTNRRGGAKAGQGQVLVTTQQMVGSRSRGSFLSATDFYYRDRPRAVRVWEEAWLPGAALSLNRYDLANVLKPLRFGFAAVGDAVEAFFVSLRDAKNGDVVTVPDFFRDNGVTLDEALGCVEGGSADQRAALTSLWILGGRATRICQDGKTGNTAITWKDTLPADLAPLLVLDASGRVRQTYQDIKDYRGSLVKLKEGHKDYSPLNVHVWHTAGSKSGWSRRGPELVQGIAKTIQTKPDQKWLVVHHKPSSRVPDVTAEVTKLLPKHIAANVSFLNWGKHQATNDYRDVPNVILAGTLFMRPSHYASLTYMARGRRMDQAAVEASAFHRTMAGEHKNLLLQAVCRGRVRQLDGDKCRPMDTYVIAAPATGIPASMKDVFPGCQVKRWAPLGEPVKALSGHLKVAIEFVEGELEKGVDMVTYKSIQAAIGVDRRNFGDAVSNHPEWLEAVTSLCLEVRRGKRAALALHLLPDAVIDD